MRSEWNHLSTLMTDRFRAFSLSRSLSTSLNIAMLVVVAGCHTTPHNDDPDCVPCSQYINLTENLPSCPAPTRQARPMVDTRWSNLVLEGGGVKGVAYVGAFTALRDHDQLDAISHVAGTSAGSLMGLLLSLGYSAEEMQQIVLQLDFKKFRDGRGAGEVLRLVEDFGLYKGDYAQCVLECLVEYKTGSKTTNFTQLSAMRASGGRFLDPVFFGTDVNTSRSIPFSRDINAEVPLAHAARISMSIPFFFAAREYNNNIFVDGGVLRNYPIDYYDNDGFNPGTLGFHLGGEPAPAKVDNLAAFTRQLLKVIMNMQVAELCDVPENVKRTAFLPTLGISTTDFDITRDQKCDLMNAAYESTAAYLSAPDHDESCPQHVMELVRKLRQ